MAITPVALSGATQGRGIKVTATATAGTTIHTCDSSATDEIYLFLENKHTADVLVTIEWGGATDPDDIEEITLSKAAVLTLDGRRPVCKRRLSNSLVVRCFASVANVVVVTGHVNRYT